MSLPENLNPLYRNLLGGPKDPIKDAPPRIRPIIELVDLTMFDGTGLVLPIELTQDFDYVLQRGFVKVSRVVVLHTWPGTTTDYDFFAGGYQDIHAVSDSLDNGFQISVGQRDREIPLFDIPISSTKDYMRYAFDVSNVVDTFGASKKVYFTSRLSFHKFMRDADGIDTTLGNRVRITGPKAGDAGIGTYGTEFTYAFEGWGWDV